VRAVLVPGVLALLPEYAGLTDPVAELRSACLEAVAWLGEDVRILADTQGERVARGLLLAAGVSTRSGPQGAFAAQPAVATLVVGNGSARRTAKAPGFLDPRAASFDDGLRAALLSGDVTGLDLGLGRDLLASLDAIARLGEVVAPGADVTVDYDDDPYGVQYWVMRWEW
jgi:hypothetical protein